MTPKKELMLRVIVSGKHMFGGRVMRKIYETKVFHISTHGSTYLVRIELRGSLLKGLLMQLML
ncbi:hypothetical protein CsSME_00014112 [Camellia sinensis var. sinensis]